MKQTVCDLCGSVTEHDPDKRIEFNWQHHLIGLRAYISRSRDGRKGYDQENIDVCRTCHSHMLDAAKALLDMEAKP